MTPFALDAAGVIGLRGGAIGNAMAGSATFTLQGWTAFAAMHGRPRARDRGPGVPDSLPRWAAEEGYPVTRFDRAGEASWTITVQQR